MIPPAETPLDPPPRKAHFRRGVRNLRRAYSSVFLLTIVVLLGWAALDALHWNELTGDQRILAVGFGLGGLLAFAVWRLVDLPLRRELRLARRGIVVRGRVVSLRKTRGKRPGVVLAYAFVTASGDSMTGECKLSRRFPSETLTPEMEIEILYDPKEVRVNKPRLGLEFIEFGNRKPLAA